MPDNATVISAGQDGLLRRTNARTGSGEAPFPVRHLGAVTALAVGQSGRLLATGGADNTVRLWDAASGALVMTFTTLPPSGNAEESSPLPSTDWLAITANGYYDGSANATRQIQWRVGPDLFPVDAFEAQRHLASRLAETLKAAMDPSLPPPVGPTFVPLTMAPGSVQARVGETAPPRILFVSPAENSAVDKGVVVVRGIVTNSQRVESMELRVNGRLVSGSAIRLAQNATRIGPKPLTLDAKPLTLDAKPITLDAKPLTLDAKPLTLDAKSLPAGHKFYQEFQAEFAAPAAGREVVVTVTAVDSHQLGAREELHLVRSVPDEKGALLVLSVGVSAYRNPKFNLKYARADADAFGGLWKAHSGALYKSVTVIELTDERATADSIRAALFKLAEQANEQDCVAIFLSGHGVQDGDAYYFASYEVEPEHSRLAATALPWTALQTALSSIKARRVILFLDACHSGNALGPLQPNSERFAEALVKRAGVMVFASSRGSEYSYEIDSAMHGAFTEALIEGLGQAKANLEIGGQKADTISAEDLLAYLRRRVPQLTENRQTPSCPLIRDFGDTFPLVQVR